MAKGVGGINQEDEMKWKWQVPSLAYDWFPYSTLFVCDLFGSMRFFSHAMEPWKKICKTGGNIAVE